MGLSGRKVKQRIGNDPRNLTWADNAAKFGQSYLEKFGWGTGQGLGANADGRTSHIKVAQKLDFMGIGAQHQKDPEGIAWNQNREFESLLRRLNEGNGEVGGREEAGEEEAGEEGVKKGERKRKKKKEHEDGDEDGDEEGRKLKRRRKDSEGEKKSKKKRKDKDGEEASSSKDVEQPAHVKSEPVKTVVAISTKTTVRRLPAHKARLIAAKRMAATNSSAVSEILGIASSASTSTSTSTPVHEQEVEVPPAMDQLTVSSKSVADYFKEKMAMAAAAKSSTPASTAASRDEEEDAPRMGLGMGARRPAAGDDARPSTGFGSGFKMSSALSSFFSAPATATDSPDTQMHTEETVTVADVIEDGKVEDEDEEKEEKSSKKRSKAKSKEKKKSKNKKTSEEGDQKSESEDREEGKAKRKREKEERKQRKEKKKRRKEEEGEE